MGNRLDCSPKNRPFGNPIDLIRRFTAPQLSHLFPLGVINKIGKTRMTQGRTKLQNTCGNNFGKVLTATQMYRGSTVLEAFNPDIFAQKQSPKAQIRVTQRSSSNKWILALTIPSTWSTGTTSPLKLMDHTKPPKAQSRLHSTNGPNSEPSLQNFST